MLDPRFPAECAILFMAITTLHGEPTTVPAIATLAHIQTRSVERQLAKLRDLGAIVSTRGNHSLTFTLLPPSAWKGDPDSARLEAAPAPHEPSPISHSDIMPGLPDPSIINHQPRVALPTRLTSSPISPHLPVPSEPWDLSSAAPARDNSLALAGGPAADASLSLVVEILNLSKFWKGQITRDFLHECFLEFPHVNMLGLAKDFHAKFGLSERTWPKTKGGWAKARVPDWPKRFRHHIQQHIKWGTEYTTADGTRTPRSPATTSTRCDWRQANAAEREVAYATARLKLRSEGQSELAIRDKLEDYARLIYEGKLT